MIADDSSRNIFRRHRVFAVIFSFLFLAILVGSVAVVQQPQTQSSLAAEGKTDSTPNRNCGGSFEKCCADGVLSNGRKCKDADHNCQNNLCQPKASGGGSAPNNKDSGGSAPAPADKNQPAPQPAPAAKEDSTPNRNCGGAGEKCCDDSPFDGRKCKDGNYNCQSGKCQPKPPEDKSDSTPNRNCGALGEKCCEDSPFDGRKCKDANVNCQGGTCALKSAEGKDNANCGGPGEACCGEGRLENGRRCMDADYNCQSGVCQVKPEGKDKNKKAADNCGGAFEKCCDSDVLTSGRKCIDSNFNCKDSENRCFPRDEGAKKNCGGAGEICCADGVLENGRKCMNGSDSCEFGRCLPKDQNAPVGKNNCGGEGEACCADKVLGNGRKCIDGDFNCQSGKCQLKSLGKGEGGEGSTCTDTLGNKTRDCRGILTCKKSSVSPPFVAGRPGVCVCPENHPNCESFPNGDPKLNKPNPNKDIIGEGCWDEINGEKVFRACKCSDFNDDVKFENSMKKNPDYKPDLNPLVYNNPADQYKQKNGKFVQKPSNPCNIISGCNAVYSPTHGGEVLCKGNVSGDIWGDPKSAGPNGKSPAEPTKANAPAPTSTSGGGGGGTGGGGGGTGGTGGGTGGGGTPSGKTANPTATPGPNSANVTFELRLKFQGIVKQPASEFNKMTVRVALSPTLVNTGVFTSDANGIWSGKVSIANAPINSKLRVYIKGPKHIQKRICRPNPTENPAGTFTCEDPAITLQAGENDLNFSNILQLSGDLPEQDGVVDAADVSFIRQNLTSRDSSDLAIGDINLDGVISTQDYSLVIAALSIKTDDASD